MDITRYSIALFIIFVTPGVFLYWFSIHRYVKYWRRLGPRVTLGIHIPAMLVIAWGVWFYRLSILRTEYGTSTWTIIASVICFGMAGIIRFKQARQFPNRTLIGVSELQMHVDADDLVTEGIYARVRHPRYIELVIGFFAYAFFANYLALYIVAVLSIVWVVLLVPVEERELLNRFGGAYQRYCERTPRFLPRW